MSGSEAGPLFGVLFASFMGGLLVGSHLMGMSDDDHATLNEANALIEECQSSLPRDQYCELEAIVSETRPD